MYKTTFFSPQAIFLGNFSKDVPPLIDEYIDGFVKQGFELVSMTEVTPVGFMFIWKKSS